MEPRSPAAPAPAPRTKCARSVSAACPRAALTRRRARLNVRAIAAGPSENLLATGGTEGDVKLWDVRMMGAPGGAPALVHTWENAHEKGIFVRAASGGMGTYGVMDLMLTDSFVLSCGADGRVVRRHLSVAY